MDENKINENKVKPEEMRVISQKEKELVAEIYDKYIKWSSVVNSPFKQFNGLNLRQYLRVSRRLFWGYDPDATEILNENLNKGKFNIFLPEIRNNILEILSYFLSLRVKPVINAGIDLYKNYIEHICSGVYENWRNVTKDRIEKFWDYLYLIENGTLIKYVGYENVKVKKEYIKPEKDGNFSFKEREVQLNDEVIAKRIPLENIFFPKLYEPDIAKQGECILIERPPKAQFDIKYGNFERSKYVVEGSRIHPESAYADIVPLSTVSDKVEVVKYFDENEDRYVIIANGVWLNPKNEKEDVFPLPYNHKKIPFEKVVFEPFDANFFYGLNLGFKLRTPQQIYNLYNELLLVREMKEISPPILTSDFEAPTIKFGPSKVIPVQDVNAWKELNISPASPSFFQALSLLKANLSIRSPVVPLSSRQPRSATEKKIESYRTNQFYENYLRMIWDLFYQEINLVLKTAFQYYPASKIIKETIFGRREFNRVMKIANANLPSGGVGTLEIRMTPKPSYWEELEAEAAIRGRNERAKVEIIEVTPEFLESLDFVITAIQLEQENPPAMEQALFKEKLAFIVQTFGRMVSPVKALLRSFEVLKENPSDWLDQNTLEKLYSAYEESIEGGAPELLLGAPNLNTQPQTQNLLQTLRGIESGARGGLQNTLEGEKFGSHTAPPITE